MSTWRVDVTPDGLHWRVVSGQATTVVCDSRIDEGIAVDAALEYLDRWRELVRRGKTVDKEHLMAQCMRAAARQR